MIGKIKSFLDIRYLQHYVLAQFRRVKFLIIFYLFFLSSVLSLLPLQYAEPGQSMHAGYPMYRI